jgi:hypothetical protein
MRLKKIMDKAVNTITNPEQTKKLNKWKNKLEKARIAYGKELEYIKRRDELYNGTREVQGNPNSHRNANKLAVNVRNVTYELIESQVDSSVPSPRVIPIHEEDEEAAKVIEAFLTNEMLKLHAELLNDQDERTTFVQGGDFYHIEWDSSKNTHTTHGDIAISLRHPRQVIPQPGVMELEKMDYIFILHNMSKQFIKKKYGVDVEAAAVDNQFTEQDPQSYLDDIATVTQVYYRNKKGGIGLFIWCDDYVLEDLEDYQKRKLMVCAKCGKPKTGDVCECGSKKFKEEEQEYETLTEDIITFGEVIPATYEEQVQATDLSGNPAVDEMGMPIMTFEQRQTKVPFYKPNVLPIVLRKNVSKYNKLLGCSDVDVIQDQQDAVTKIGSKIQEKILMGGSYLKLPKGLEVETSDGEYKIVRCDQSNFNMIGVVTTQAEIGQDLSMLNQNYSYAQSALGITDAYQGKYDASARSGSAKQYSINQAAGRLESKRVMKNAAYAELYEMMFKFALAYSDTPMPISGERSDGSKEYQSFDRHMFLKKDDAGEYYWNDEFKFDTDPTSTIMTNREAMWQQIDMKLQSGAFGAVGDLQTSLLYWTLMEKNGYPNAKTVKDDIQARIDEQKGMMQNEMPPMPSGNGNIPLDLQGLG